MQIYAQAVGGHNKKSDRRGVCQRQGIKVKAEDFVCGLSICVNEHPVTRHLGDYCPEASEPLGEIR